MSHKIGFSSSGSCRQAIHPLLELIANLRNGLLRLLDFVLEIDAHGFAVLG